MMQQQVPAERSQPSPLRILIVDDEEDIRESLKACIERRLMLPVEVETAADGLEARERLAKGQRFDMVVTDERMPGMRGVDLLAWMREHTPASQRVLMSAFGQRGLLREAVDRAGVALFIAKPFQIDRDLANLRAVLGDKRAPGRAGNA